MITFMIFIIMTKYTIIMIFILKQIDKWNKITIIHKTDFTINIIVYMIYTEYSLYILYMYTFYTC